MATIKSIEEKAKRYDEAIKRVEDIEAGKCQKPFMFTEGLFDYIFPELKESEDERIMKALYKMAKVPRKEIYEAEGITKEQALAWLEKQGDYYKGFRDGYNSGIHEEKPLKWTKHDELVRKEAISCLKHWKNCIPTTWNEDYKNILMWLENELSVHTEKQSDKPQGKSALEAIKEEKVDNANKVEPRQEKLTEFEKAVKQVMEEAIECGDTRNLKADAEMLLSLVHKSAWSEDDDIEYTRTDAFIKKAKKWFEQQPETYDANGVRCYSMEDFENFVNYMKGE